MLLMSHIYHVFVRYFTKLHIFAVFLLPVSYISYFCMISCKNMHFSCVVAGQLYVIFLHDILQKYAFLRCFCCQVCRIARNVNQYDKSFYNKLIKMSTQETMSTLNYNKIIKYLSLYMNVKPNKWLTRPLIYTLLETQDSNNTDKTTESIQCVLLTIYCVVSIICLTWHSCKAKGT